MDKNKEQDQMMRDSFFPHINDYYTACEEMGRDPYDPDGMKYGSHKYAHYRGQAQKLDQALLEVERKLKNENKYGN